jgi:hypothetical protein
MANKKPKEPGHTLPWWLAGGVAVLCGAWYLLGIIVFKEGNDTPASIMGNIYDVLSALFAGLAGVGVLYTLALQRYDLALARWEAGEQEVRLGQQQREAETQRQEDKRDLDIRLAEQRFRDQFFQLLDLLNSDAIHMQRGSVEGHRVVEHVVTNLRNRYGSPVGNRPDPIEVARIAFFDSTVYPQFQSAIDPYLRTVGVILRMIDDAAATIPNWRLYLDILRTRFSRQQMSLLFYHSLFAGRQAAETKVLLEQYRFFDVPILNLLEEAHRNAYLEGAFGEETTIQRI